MLTSLARKIATTKKKKFRNPPAFLPRPLSAGGKSAEAGQIQNPRKIVCPAESVSKPRHLPEYLEGRIPKEKHPFLFQKKFHPRQIRNARSVFLSGLPRLCGAVAGLIHSFNFRSKKVRAKCIITAQNI